MKKALLSKVIEVHTDIPEVQVLLETLFQAFPTGQGVPAAVYTIRASNGKLWVLESNGEGEVPLFSADSPLEAVYLLESFFSERLIPLERSQLVLHAAVVAKEGKALLLLGPSGSGKSLLTTALLKESERFCYLSDDVAPLSVDPKGNSFCVFPFPRAIRLRDWTVQPFTLPSGQCLSLTSYSLYFFLPVQRFAVTEFPVSLLFFPERRQSRSEFLWLRKGETALYLTGLTYNKAEYIVGGGLGLIAQLAKEVPAYRLLWNEPFQAAEAIEKLFSEAR